jgi:hypothetical protein
MLAAPFRSNQPAVLAVLLVLVPVLFWSALGTSPAPAGHEMPLQALVLRTLGTGPWAQGLFSMALVLLVAVQLTALMNNTDQADRRHHLPALLFPLLLAATGQTLRPDSALLGMPFVLWSLRRGWSITNTGKALSPLFDAGLLLGIAALFYLPYAFLVVVLWASASVIRPFHWREYVAPVLGCAVIIYMAWGVLFLRGLTPWRPLQTIVEAARKPEVLPVAVQWSYAIVIGLVVLFALANFASGYQRGVMRVKNMRSSFLAFGAGQGVIMAAAWALNGRVPPVLLAAPLAIFCSHAFLGQKRPWLRETGIGALIALAFWAQWS